MDGAIASVFATLSRTEVAERLLAGNIAFGFVNDLAALARHPALRRTQVSTPNGVATMAAPPVLHGDAFVALGPVPAIGVHSASIRTEFSVSTRQQPSIIQSLPKL